MSQSSSSLSDIVTQAFSIEINALNQVATAQDPEILRAIETIHASRGSVIIAGIGKSGHIARKIASTFCSLGKRAVFLQAAEASHGDLGIIEEDSVVLVLSNSGETSELSDLLHFCQARGHRLIALTANGNSTLAKFADVTIAYGKHPEACLHGLAPTTSTTLQLAIGDAICIGVSHLMGFQPEDFRKYHPGGRLGARLLKVADIMHSSDDLPIVAPTALMSDVVVTMTRKALGAALVMEGTTLKGIITDGDMRRNAQNLWTLTAQELASADPITISPDTTIDAAVETMNARGITVIVVQEGTTLGLVHMHQCLAKGAS